MAIPQFHNMEDKDKATEHNSAVEENTSNEAGTSSEVKISLLFQRWNVTIITRGIVLFYSIFLFVLFSAVFLLLLEVRAFEADQFDRLNFSLIEEREGSSSSRHRCFLFDRALKHCCDKCLRSVSPLRYAMWCHRYRW